MNLKKIMLLISAIVVMLIFISKCYSYDGIKEFIIVDGLKREYIVFQKEDRDGPHEKAPLLIVLHGGGGNGAKMQKMSGFDAIARHENLVTIYPDAVKNHWNDKRNDCNTYAHKNNIDDVEFLSKIIDEVKVKYNIDESRVYIAGVSNGGMMAHLFAIEKGGQIAAMASVIAGIAENIKDKKPAAALPVLIINGDKDMLVKWDGGVVAQNRGKILGARKSVEFWVNNNGCKKTPLVERLGDKDPGDGTVVIKETYAASDKGAEVVFYIIKGGGHCWPGKKAGLLYKWLISKNGEGGSVCMDINAADEIWNFFKTKKSAHIFQVNK